MPVVVAAKSFFFDAQKGSVGAAKQLKHQQEKGRNE
jgi:hypothetical protein